MSFQTADIDETSIRKEKPEELVMALAEAKADAIISRLQSTGQLEGAEEKLLITADTVYFHDIPEEVIDSLVEEAITLNVAGGLTLENPLILRFVEAVIGTSDAVMGLPKALTEKLIREAL
ncbi:hypothetical protein TIFTF001_043569 [Ficus carica]|uniref:Maf-like protein n=1 Tax=Ficus carica TaxID=3494 RepID=A0AA88CMV0_FICCA|nr:hypothetical protein TIFTF001_043569 [Ficus carica]